MKFRTQVRGTDRAKRSIAAYMKRLSGHRQVLVGVQKGAGDYEDGTPIAVIASANQFGATLPNGVEIPARPFLDVAINKNRKKYARTMAEMLPKVLDGEPSVEEILDTIGLQAVGDVQEYMVELHDPPNSPVTIAKKGSNNPLIDTGNLRQSIRHEIAKEPVEEGL